MRYRWFYSVCLQEIYKKNEIKVKFTPDANNIKVDLHVSV